MILAEQDERQDRRRYFRPETLVAIDALVPRWDLTSMSSRLSC